MQGGEYDTLTFSIICEPSRGVPSCMTQGIPRDFSVPLLPARTGVVPVGRGGSRGRGERHAVWRCGVEREGRCAARGNAARCVGRCSALRCPMQCAAMACAPHCAVCPAMPRDGAVVQRGVWGRASGGMAVPLAYAGSVLWRLSLRDAKMVGKYGAEPFAVRFPGLRGRITGEFCIFAAPIYM